MGFQVAFSRVDDEFAIQQMPFSSRQSGNAALLRKQAKDWLKKAHRAKLQQREHYAAQIARLVFR